MSEYGVAFNLLDGIEIIVTPVHKILHKITSFFWK